MAIRRKPTEISHHAMFVLVLFTRLSAMVAAANWRTTDKMSAIFMDIFCDLFNKVRYKRKIFPEEYAYLLQDDDISHSSIDEAF
jgi:hypothetical protein